MILRCWDITEWLQLVDKLGQQEAAMAVIINKVTSRHGLWRAPIGWNFNFQESPIVRQYSFVNQSPALCVDQPRDRPYAYKGLLHSDYI